MKKKKTFESLHQWYNSKISHFFNVYKIQSALISNVLKEELYKEKKINYYNLYNRDVVNLELLETTNNNNEIFRIYNHYFTAGLCLAVSTEMFVD